MALTFPELDQFDTRVAIEMEQPYCTANAGLFDMDGANHIQQ